MLCRLRDWDRLLVSVLVSATLGVVSAAAPVATASFSRVPSWILASLVSVAAFGFEADPAATGAAAATGAVGYQYRFYGTLQYPEY